MAGRKKSEEGECRKNDDCCCRLAEGVDIHAGSRIVAEPKQCSKSYQVSKNADSSLKYTSNYWRFENWDKAINDALQGCAHFLIVLSPRVVAQRVPLRTSRI